MTTAPLPTPRFFRKAATFGTWLSKHHATRTELWVGLYKKHAAARGMTYPEAVDEALCWGWIDGVMRSMDGDRTMQRFTPRKSRSTWSLVNLGKVKALMAAGRMRPPGVAAFEARETKRTGIYSFEQPKVALSAANRRRFRSVPDAWRWFSAQAPSYQRVAIHWAQTAKQEATRKRRLLQLIEHCAAGKKLRQFTPMPKRKS